jgi:murein DD-endopeptidase MepM/ murein hydrolase activator NlpD
MIGNKYPGGIKAGSYVKQGQIIGYEGATGRVTGAHLHWMVQLNGLWVNPRRFV